MKLGYARVSTVDQHLRLQLDALEKHECDRVWQDKASGVKYREQLDMCLQFLRPGDSLVVWKLDRLARSVTELIAISQFVEEAGCGIVFLTQNIDTTTPMGKLFFHIMCALAEFERENTLERAKAGRIAAKLHGVRFGKPFSIKPGVFEAAYAEYLDPDRTMTVERLCERHGIKRRTFYTAIRRHKEKQETTADAVTQPSGTSA